MNNQMKKACTKEKDQDWDYYESAEPQEDARPRHEIPEREELPLEEPMIEDKSKKLISWVGHIFQPFSTFGPFSISWDTWKACIWGILRPKVTARDDTRNSIFNIMRKILRPHGWTLYIEYSDLYNVFLMPGDVL
jgi:hypothetical protein